MGNRGLRSGYDDVRLWENFDGCRRSDAAPSEPSHAPHRVDERQDHLGHGRLPHLRRPRPHDGLSVERHGQPVNGEWKHCPLRDGSAFIDAAGMRHRREPCPLLDHEFEHYAGVRWACDDTFRAAGYSWRRTYRARRLGQERKIETRTEKIDNSPSPGLRIYRDA